MVDAHLNYFDMVVIGIMCLSCIFAFFRGFVKEILSLIAWVGAAYITVRFFPSLAEKLQPHFAKPITAVVCATAVLYLGSLIGFAIFNRIIIKILKSGSEIGWLDNLLGLAFGALRGAFIVSLSYLMISVVIKDDNRPEWLEKAVTRPYAEKGALMLAKIAPAYIDELSNLEKKAKNKMQDSRIRGIEGQVYVDRSTYDNGSDSEPSVNQNTISPANASELGGDAGDGEGSDGSFESLLKNLSKK